ncbi:phosphoribosylformylglycinamidine synthase subunit PurL [Candidatus Woesearchaeota archaeon]|nr:phosphoribosylformylglycinamidine synthase subunit PurL [Candidatus Woesearchaeota archaeon]
MHISKMSDDELASFMKKNVISLKINEARSLPKKLGRDPTLTELHIFNIQWSEHSSYKSSKKILKQLPTTGKKVILGPKEDSGIVEFCTIDGEKYCIVVSHESHNHPSQVVPFEGAATGIGGDIRDVLCMGAHVIGVADPLRFGNPDGKNRNVVRYVANSVVEGIAGYGNPVGIPNLGGDVYFDESFDDNCLVNVVCIGMVKEKDILHSYAPEGAVGFDVIVVGKATDNSGFGGAAFASLILDEGEEQTNKGAVQVPDPFLKNVVIRATEKVFKELREKNIIAGFKDMGAGGIMCATSELGSSGGYGMDLDIDKIHVSMKNLPPYVIASGETQERFTWIVPPDFTPRLIQIYNEEFDLPNVAKGARASVIGKVTKEKQYRLTFKGKVVCNAPIDEVTEGVSYERECRAYENEFKEPALPEPNCKEILLKLLRQPHIASKERIFKHYDTEVQGNAVIRPGEADSGLIAPIRGKSFGIALATDCNPFISRVDPYWGAAHAVAESMRNVAAIGAIPVALTDCLNYGNPEKPEAFWEFVQGVKGVSDAARGIKEFETKEAVPVISGNVSFYNENKKGTSVSPSAIICCVGMMKDYSKAVTTAFKKEGSLVYLIGSRKDELGGSSYYRLFNEYGKDVPKLDFDKEARHIYSVIDIIDKNLALSCHDISDGGLAVALAEMAILGRTGVIIKADSKIRFDRFIFSETPGFIIEVEEKNKDAVEKILNEKRADFSTIGRTIADKFIIKNNDNDIINASIEEIEEPWRNGLVEALR